MRVHEERGKGLKDGGNVAQRQDSSTRGSMGTGTWDGEAV